MCSQIHQLEQANKTDDEEMDLMREEFTHRIGDTDRKLQAAIKVMLIYTIVSISYLNLMDNFVFIIDIDSDDLFRPFMLFN